MMMFSIVSSSAQTTPTNSQSEISKNAQTNTNVEQFELRTQITSTVEYKDAKAQFVLLNPNASIEQKRQFIEEYIENNKPN